jgi:hypothetical protein
MAFLVHHLLTLEDETLVGIARAGTLVNDPLKRKIHNFPGAWPCRGLAPDGCEGPLSRPGQPQNEEAADEGASTGSAY